MLRCDNALRNDLVLAVNGALLGSVTPNLRGVAVDWEDQRIRIVCYFHGPVSAEDQETMSVVGTEVAADFIDNMSVQLATERLDLPAKMNGLRAWVFERKE